MYEMKRNKTMSLIMNNNYMLFNLRKYSTYLALEKSNFYFCSFYVKYKAYFPNNLLPSNNFLCWFVGLTEGEGCFIVNNRGDLCFVITQSTSDINVLYFIQETLGFGKVISQSIKTSRYVTQSKKEIEIIISIFNGNLVLPSRQKNLIFLLKDLTVELKKVELG